MSLQPSLLLLTSDVFFSAKVGGTAAELGWKVRTVATAAGLPSGTELAGTQVVLVDLELPGLPPAELAERMKTADVRLVGYAPHVKKHLFEAATVAGFDELLSRGGLSAGLVERLRVWAQ